MLGLKEAVRLELRPLPTSLVPGLPGLTFLGPKYLGHIFTGEGRSPGPEKVTCAPVTDKAGLTKPATVGNSAVIQNGGLKDF